MNRRDARQEPIPKPSRPIQKGDLVELPGVRTLAEVVSVGSDGTLAAQGRHFEDDGEGLGGAAHRGRRASGQGPQDRHLPALGPDVLRTVAAASELDIRGMETLEAEGVVEQFIDSAVMGRLETVTIIHGKGTGALRKMVHDLLRRNKAVKSYRLGVYGEGEAGVTVVTLK